MAQGGEPGARQGPLDQGGGRKGAGTGGQVWAQEVDADRAAPQGPHREAVPRALAQPPQPQDQEDGLDGGGGSDHLSGAPPVREPVGAHRQAASRADGQRHQEPLELHHEAQVRPGAPRRVVWSRPGPRRLSPLWPDRSGRAAGRAAGIAEPEPRLGAGSRAARTCQGPHGVLRPAAHADHPRPLDDHHRALGEQVRGVHRVRLECVRGESLAVLLFRTMPCQGDWSHTPFLVTSFL